MKAIFQVGAQGRTRRTLRQFVLALGGVGLGVVLSSCSGGEPEPPPGTIGHVQGFLGGVVADEPRAALVGRDILSQGGSAADAATAMYFTMAVTLPSRAGLGGGGVCLAFDADTGQTDMLDFTAVAAAQSAPGIERPSAIPANPRGFFALQARLGSLQWREVVAPAEQLARFGHPVSRAFARDLAAIGPALLADAGARRMFSTASGQPAGEGDVVKQTDLAATLSMIRARGVGPFYAGVYANQLIEAVARAGGGPLSVEALRGYTPTWRKPLRMEYGSEVVHFATPPAAASAVAGELFAMLDEDGRFDGADEATRARIVAELGLRAFADRETWLDSFGRATRDVNTLLAPDRIERLVAGFDPQTRSPLTTFPIRPQSRNETPATTAFAAADRDGNAVSCAVTMNQAFGTGRVAPGTGVMLAAAPGADGRGPLGLAVMLMTNENSKTFHFAGAASGGVVASTALAQVAGRAILAEEGLESAVARPRVHASGDPDLAFVEPSLSEDAQVALSLQGFSTAATPTLGLVNAIQCLGGLSQNQDACHMAVDPRGFGLAAGSMQ